MNAQEARNITENAKPKDSELKPIYEAINAAAKNGESEILYYQKICDLGHNLLKSQGYKIEYHNDRDGIMYRIKW